MIYGQVIHRNDRISNLGNRVLHRGLSGRGWVYDKMHLRFLPNSRSEVARISAYMRLGNRAQISLQGV